MSWQQDTGIAEANLRQVFATDAAPKALGSGFFALLAAMRDGVASTLWAGVHFLWLGWMILGLARAKHRGEKFCPSKMQAGVWRLVAADAVWMICVVIERVGAEQGQQWPVAAAALGWMGVTFFIRSADALSYFFPGLREALAKAAPALFPTEKVNPGRRISDAEARLADRRQS